MEAASRVIIPPSHQGRLGIPLDERRGPGHLRHYSTRSVRGARGSVRTSMLHLIGKMLHS